MQANPINERLKTSRHKPIKITEQITNSKIIL